MHMLKRKAFTLIELMLVITIIGILSTVAVPAYSEYVYNAKLAEGYIGVGAVNKSQIAFFYENRFFNRAIIGGVATPTPGTCACAPASGTKAVLDIEEFSSKALGMPIGPSPQFFAYESDGVRWDAAGSNPETYEYDERGNGSFVREDPDSWTV